MLSKKWDLRLGYAGRVFWGLLIRCIAGIHAILTILTMTDYTQSTGIKVDAPFIPDFPQPISPTNLPHRAYSRQASRIRTKIPITPKSRTPLLSLRPFLRRRSSPTLLPSPPRMPRSSPTQVVTLASLPVLPRPTRGGNGPGNMVTINEKLHF